jgi:type II secretory pathway component PulM
MTKRATKYFWSDWPEPSRQRLFRLAPMGTVVLALSVFIGMRLFAGTVTQQIEESKAQYGRVLPLVEDIRSLRAQQGDLAHLPVEKAVWAIIDDLLMEQQLTSIRDTRLNEDETALQATFTGISLNSLAKFLLALRDRASLQTRDFTLTRNNDDPRLCDAHFVLAR